MQAGLLIGIRKPCRECYICEEGATEEDAQEDVEEGALHLATHVFVLALSLLL